MTKESQLRALLREMNAAAIAYSGGIDSTLLAYLATAELGQSALSVLVSTELVPEYQEQDAIQTARILSLNLLVVREEPLQQEIIASNPPERCYYCKKLLFGKIIDLAADRGIRYVLDGANADDSNDFRPGERATKELGVRSPYKELGIGKQDIREIAHRLNIPVWNKPSYACLASRVPYGVPLDPDTLRRIGEAERFLNSLGFAQCRVRHHGKLARIELTEEDIQRLIASGMRQQISEHFRKLGYHYTALDLLGYRTGSMNETL